MLRSAIIIAGLVGATGTLAESPSVIPGPVPADYLSAYDGDTVTVRAWIWPGQSVETTAGTPTFAWPTRIDAPNSVDSRSS
ncbi:hypothetical protein [Oceanibaculum sp.]|uniref:hypothetical protein n=1 Tax=Oceanibaculum sp. TaxID=1903597 RepID=UPI0025859AD7|nr:hypothetical protein [Oceanibaculum sp.]MCH2394344.1 hypothetical protein [Oceanibaculum sp.]